MKFESSQRSQILFSSHCMDPVAIQVQQARVKNLPMFL